MFQSSLLNTNLRAYTSWKGKTLGQITSSVQKNENTADMKGKLLFQPPPLKISRREAFTKPLKVNSFRNSTSIDVLQQPGSALVVFDDTPSDWTVCNNDCSGNKYTLDINLENNRGQRGLCCDNTIAKQLNPANVALARVRSSGMIKKTPPSSVTTAPYSTTSKEYLTTRGKTFKQNEFHYLESGNALVKPGAPGSENNKYAVNDNGGFYCSDPNYYIETQFKPTNYKYSKDGAVSSSARTNRLNYNTITTNGDLYTKAYGSQVGNALSYGKSSDAYTIKDKIGVVKPCKISSKTTKKDC